MANVKTAGFVIVTQGNKKIGYVKKLSKDQWRASFFNHQDTTEDNLVKTQTEGISWLLAQNVNQPIVRYFTTKPEKLELVNA
jgi:hypothetical protein